MRKQFPRDIRHNGRTTGKTWAWISTGALHDLATAPVFALTAGSGDSYRIERLCLDGEQACGFARDYNGIAPVEPLQVEEWQVGAPPAAYDLPYWRAEWWVRVPVAKVAVHRGTRVRANGLTTSPSARNGPGMPRRTPRWCAGNWPGCPALEVVGLSRVKVEEMFWDTITQVRADWPKSPEMISAILCVGWNETGMALDPSALVRHDACMDRRALERIGQYIVSRRVALGYRNRTDLASSLKLTVRTLADIEHGVRKASPGTYAMLENKLAWAPAASTPSWPAGNPTKPWSSCAQRPTARSPAPLPCPTLMLFAAPFALDSSKESSHRSLAVRASGGMAATGHGSVRGGGRERQGRVAATALVFPVR